MTSAPARTVALVTLGCARNEVDSEELAGRLAADGWALVADAADADAVLVNTCGFIEAAKKDSVDTLLAASDAKSRTRTKAVVAVGCMAERYGTELAGALPEADAVLGFDAYADISARLAGILAGDRPASHTPSDRRKLLPISPVDRRTAAAAVPGHAQVAVGEAPGTPASGPRAVLRHRLDTSVVASLKLASGCDRRCAFCAIPSFRGSFVSRDPEEVLAEAEWLAARGVRELVLVSENSTSYGKDLGDLALLEKLLPQLAAVDGIVRVRPVYLQPAEMRPGLVDVLTGTPGVAAYADLSFQHAAGPLLRRMRRFGDAASFLALLAQLRERAPELGARSNVIVGFPGEKPADVRVLEQFLEAARLDAIGVFGYSDEEGTEGATLDGKVGRRTIDARVRRLRDLAEQLVDERAGERVGQHVEVLVETVDDEGAEGRAHHQQPEVDGSCTVTGLAVRPGDLVRGRVVDHVGVDLVVEGLEVVDAARGPVRGAALGGAVVPAGGAVDAATDGHPASSPARA